MRLPENPKTAAVALDHCASYGDCLREHVKKVLDAAGISISPGSRVLIKPNLLQAKKLACANASIVAHVCAWLLDQGAKVKVADSPGFGRASHVANAIGLTAALSPLGLQVEGLGNPRHVELRLPEKIILPISATALESDLIFSVARIKAHKQMRITLAVKNCFGCIPGLRKALIHAKYGKDTAFFADCLTALWTQLPPVAGFVDGVVAMEGTGPVNGMPRSLGLIGASMFAPALDEAILKILHIDICSFPLAEAMRRKGISCQAEYTLERPEDFQVGKFMVPATLAPPSFHPRQLIKSICRRLWNAVIPDRGKDSDS